MARLNRSLSLNPSTMPSNRDLLRIKLQHQPASDDKPTPQASNSAGLSKVFRTQSQKSTSSHRITVRTYSSKGLAVSPSRHGNEVVSNLTTPTTELASPREADEEEEAGEAWPRAQNQRKYLETPT